jgi:polar amino acid transport system permease protein/polar amino acid transport system substrate-binding protein
MDSLQIIIEAIPTLVKGFNLTIQISVVSIIAALIIGLSMGLLSLSKWVWLRVIATIYVDLIRGTPLLVQILFIYFGIPAAFEVKIPALVAGVFAISINSGAYMTEIFRAGIESIDRGQMEAGRSLGFSYAKTMRLVILPQAVRRMIPAFVNQFATAIKDTSLLSTIGIAELTLQGQSIYAMNYRAFQILTGVAAFYFVIIYLLSFFSRWLERRYDV